MLHYDYTFIRFQSYMAANREQMSGWMFVNYRLKLALEWDTHEIARREECAEEKR